MNVTIEGMTVAELTTMLKSDEVAPYVTSTFNSKTRKADLQTMLREAIDRKNADVPAEPAQGLNQDRGVREADLLYPAEIKTTPLTYSARMANYLSQNGTTIGEVGKVKLAEGTVESLLTPAQVRRLVKKSRSLAARNARELGGYSKAERV